MKISHLYLTLLFYETKPALVSFRSAHMLSRYRPRAPIIAVTRCGMAARQSHLWRGVYPVLYTKAANDVWAEDVDLRVNFAMEVGE